MALSKVCVALASALIHSSRSKFSPALNAIPTNAHLIMAPLVIPTK